MPLEGVGVNLWKTCKVSYLQLDSYSTESNFVGCEKCCDASRKIIANMVLLIRWQGIYSVLLGTLPDFG